MRRAIFATATMIVVACVCALNARSAAAQSNSSYTALPSGASAGANDAQTVDGIAARIEDDILMESEVRELSAFQQLVDGHAKSRAEVIQELVDQWIVRGEATTAKYPLPSKEDVDRATTQFEEQFSSPAEFEKRRLAAGLTEPAIRRMVEQQLYLARFLDYRFRPAAQVDDKQIAAYYNDEFATQLKARGETVPPLEDVEDTIREVLVQRAISERATKWQDETRSSLRIDIVSDGAAR
jgi:hypothetical protein